ncbi:hypothetical protein C8J57DRAFT_1238053 [Mycena rebaudengoi]|nr:hypothetical protein C8J57DRAFT_1238053 [Mycena rebaudengoi]
MADNNKMSLNFVLGPEPPHSPVVDVRPLLDKLATLSLTAPVLAPFSVGQNLTEALAFLSTIPPTTIPPAIPPATIPPAAPPLLTPTPPIKEELDVPLNRQTRLSALYHYPIGALLEYPSTTDNDDKLFGHLLKMDPAKWICPSGNIAYSLGSPHGQTLAGKSVTCNVLVDGQGKQVPCIERHSTCQGAKACPHSDLEELSLPHTHATREDVRRRLRADRDQRIQPEVEPTHLTQRERELQAEQQAYNSLSQRGYTAPESTIPPCQGRLLFTTGHTGNVAVCCEHYSTKNKNHFHDFTVGNGSYDVSYIEAVLSEDQEEIDRIEQAAHDLGYGPLRSACQTVANANAQRACCPYEHRYAEGNLTLPALSRLSCSSRFRIYEPLPAYRRDFPFVLIVTRGAHTHPVPLPTKTPAPIRQQLMNLLEETGVDLADMTPRKFLRHAVVTAFLKRLFPCLASPTLADWHVSLANRAHLGIYINCAREKNWPLGTDWEGVARLKELQNLNLPVDSHYIRRMIAEDPPPLHEEDEVEEPQKDPQLRIIICMTKEASRRLISMGQYFQSDIAFKRISRYFEFELAAKDREANTSFGLYLQEFAQSLSEKWDVHEPWRTIQSLSPYDHLKRLGQRQNKQQVHFSGYLPRKELYPVRNLEGHRRNDNLVEQVHGDVNREGTQLSLAGGIIRGQAFDAMKMKSLQVLENYGVRPSYSAGHQSENAYKNLQRRDNAQRRALFNDEAKIERYNAKLQKAFDALKKKHETLLNQRRHFSSLRPDHPTYLVEQESLSKKENTLQKALKQFETLSMTGSSLNRGSSSLPVLRLDPNAFI